MPRSTATLLAVKSASVNDGAVTVPVLIARDGWGELRGTAGACRQLVGVLALALGLTVRSAKIARRANLRRPRVGRSPVLKPGGRIL